MRSATVAKCLMLCLHRVEDVCEVMAWISISISNIKKLKFPKYPSAMDYLENNKWLADQTFNGNVNNELQKTSDIRICNF